MLEDRGEEFVAHIVQNNRSLQIINLAVLSLYSTSRILSRKEKRIRIYTFWGKGMI